MKIKMRLIWLLTLLPFILVACSSVEEVRQRKKIQEQEEKLVLTPLYLSGEIVHEDEPLCPPLTREITMNKTEDKYNYILNLHNLISIDFSSQNMVTRKHALLKNTNSGLGRDQIPMEASPVWGSVGYYNLSSAYGDCHHVFYLKNDIKNEKFMVYCEQSPQIYQKITYSLNPGPGTFDYVIYSSKDRYRYINHLNHSIWYQREPDTFFSRHYLDYLLPTSTQDMKIVSENCLIEIGTPGDFGGKLPFKIGENSKDTVLVRVTELSEGSGCEELKKEYGVSSDFILFNQKVFCSVILEDPVIGSITLL